MTGKRDNDFLFELRLGVYIVLPGRGAGVLSQEEAMASVGRGRQKKSLSSAWLHQKDGSRMPVILSSKPATEIAWAIENTGRDRAEVWCASKDDDLKGQLIGGELGPANADYYAYRLNRFLNGSRFACLIVRKGGGRKYYHRVGTEFVGGMPEDELGVFVREEAELGLRVGEAIWLPEVIDCLSRIRLCASCGVVSDFGAVRHGPWVSWDVAVTTVKRIERAKKAPVARKPGKKPGPKPGWKLLEKKVQAGS